MRRQKYHCVFGFPDHKCNGLVENGILGKRFRPVLFSVLSLTKSKKQQQVKKDGGARLGSYGYGKMVCFKLKSKDYGLLLAFPK